MRRFFLCNINTRPMSSPRNTLDFIQHSLIKLFFLCKVQCTCIYRDNLSPKYIVCADDVSFPRWRRVESWTAPSNRINKSCPIISTVENKRDQSQLDFFFLIRALFFHEQSFQSSKRVRHSSALTLGRRRGSLRKKTEPEGKLCGLCL